VEISTNDIMATLSETVDAYSERSALKSIKQPRMAVITMLYDLFLL